MALQHSVFLWLSAMILTVSYAAKAPRCGDFCAFRLCKADENRSLLDEVGPVVLLRDENQARDPFVCRKVITDPARFLNVSVDVLKTRQAEVHPISERRVSPRPFVQISKYRPSGLSPRFPKNYFKLSEIGRGFFPAVPSGLGLSRRKSVGNQEKFVGDLCVKLPVTSYNELNRKGKITRRITNSKKEEDCISFRTRVPKILIELTWNSPDDFDVTVKEPNRNIVSSKNPRSESGARLIKDSNVGECGSNVQGIEQIRWLQNGNPKKGTYTIVVRQFLSCGPPSKWILTVVVDGRKILSRQGTAVNTSIIRNKLVTRVNFRYRP